MAARDTQPSTTTIATRKGSAVARVEPSGERTKVPTLVKDALGETIDVLQAQVELAVLEVREDAKIAARIGIVLGIGGALAVLAIALLLAAAAFALALVLPAWAACLGVGVPVAIIAGIVLARGHHRLQAHGFGEQSTLALRESTQWIREKLS
jgi:Putative Actinobacterial Holin-X, holin superfamily III